MHEIKSLLTQLSIKDSNDVEIPVDSNAYRSFFEFVDLFCRANNKIVLYRGCNPSKTFRTKIFDIKGFAEQIFMLGEKSHLFETNSYPKICIDDCSRAVFEFVFERFCERICSLNFSQQNSRETVSVFLEANPLIKNYFSHTNNKELFLLTIEGLNESEKRHVKDYYFSLLHAIGKSADGNNYFISTSKKPDIAEKFKNGGITIITWVPNTERERQIIKFNDINKLDDFIKELGLPYYETSPYNDQDEICIKGGILPHYILGYVMDESFIVNHNLLTQIQKPYDFNSIISDGINTDQTHFESYRQKTKYKGGFLCIDGFYIDY